MRHITLLLLITAALTACQIKKEGGETYYKLAPIFGGQEWIVSQKLLNSDGRKFCTVAIGELEISQIGTAKLITPQVSTVADVRPGYRYKILVAGNYYETSSDLFDAESSKRIVADFKKGGTAYSELAALYVEAHRASWRPISNKFDLSGFTAAYDECRSFIQGK